MEIKHQYRFAHPPEVVWDYLTRAELLAQWLMPNDIKPVAGHRFQFRTKPMPRFGFDGIVNCEVLEVIPFQKLTYSWRGGSLDSVVVWTLKTEGSETVLQLEHKGFKGIKNYLPYLIMNKGWKHIDRKIVKLINAISI